ncbi:M20 family metallopeptidase [Paeniglutamicibacter sp. R2-26]|uniref:M20 family metallopeptidase n=1 Tax=Paeniglutamicibacter sp. R2-26 TaxID=3144417 RepID=UPI003EE76FFD
MPELDMRGAKRAAGGNLAAIKDEVVGVSRHLHANPETGLAEVRSAGYLLESVERLTGIGGTLGLGSLPTAFRVEAGNGDLVITLCAEYDALPDIGHGCGHNIIAAAAVGAFAALAPIADSLGMTVRLLGTPAEENAGGKVTLLEEGYFDGTHAALMVHPGPFDSVRMDPLASGAIEVEFSGRPAHASASPHEGVNALDALTIMLTAIGLARQQLEPFQQIHGFVRHAGTAPNVIPGAAGGTWMARGATAESLGRVMEVIRRCAEAGAHATQATVTFREGSFQYHDLIPHDALDGAYEANLNDLGRTSSPFPKGGSTDMGNVSHRFPSIHPMIGLGQPAAVIHTEEFARLAGSETGDQAAIDGAFLLAMTAVDAALDPALRARLLSETSTSVD